MSDADALSAEDIALIRQTAHRFVRERLVPLEDGIDAADEVRPGLLGETDRPQAAERNYSAAGSSETPSPTM